MSTTLSLLSYPTDEVGVTLITPIDAWAYSDWKPIAKLIQQDINIISLEFQITNVLAVDTTYEQIYEIGVSKGSGIVTQIQFPISARCDTAVGFYLTPDRFFLPEPVTVREGASLYVRMAWSRNGTSAVVNGVKLFYEASNPVKPERYSTSMNNYQFVEVGDGMSTGERIR